MSKLEAKRLLEDIQENEELQAQLQEKPLGEAAAAARGLGYDVTEDELAAELEANRGAQDETPVELAENELDQVAGGHLWGGEEAPDGHEMGCILSYHGRDWAIENETFCKHNYVCYSDWDECVIFGRTTTTV